MPKMSGSQNGEKAEDKKAGDTDYGDRLLKVSDLISRRELLLLVVASILSPQRLFLLAVICTVQALAGQSFSHK